MTTTSTSKKLYLLISIFIVGFLSLFSLNQLFIGLVNDLDNQTNNYKFKIQIGEYISEDIFKIKSLFFELATTTTSKRARKLVENKINHVILSMNESLDVLEHGGTLKRLIELNIDGETIFNKKVTYILDKKDSIPLEVIDIRPKLIELQDMIKTVDILLSARSKAKKSKDNKAFSKAAKKVRRFYKTTPAFFNRMSENIKRLLYESDINLETLNLEIQDKKSKYMKIKMLLIVLVIGMVISLGYWISTIVNKDNIKLIKLNHELENKELAVKAILNGQDNMVIVSDGKKMLDANNSIVEFFNDIDTMEQFKEEHDCICDFFKPNENDDTYIVNKNYDGLIWLEYILQWPDINFKVLMNNGIDDYHFSLSANKKVIDKAGNFILIVSLNDITAEVISKNELAKLNNNLEHIISEKTEELQQLNSGLEIKIQEELAKNRDKDKQMMQQSRSAALGEMIGNIAHQWRQPLSAISSTASGIQLQMQLGLTTDKDIDKSYEDIKGYVAFLTQTIEDFRGFFKTDKEKIDFNIIEVVKKSLSIANAGYKDNNINVILNFSQQELLSNGLPSELSQVFLNILNNSKDATIEHNIEDRFVHVSSDIDDKYNNIYIQDNAGGIPKSIVDKVFDPYFTTKHQSQGTGIGLYMSKDIVEKNMNGTLSVQNRTITLDNQKYIGACFKISIPKKN